MNIKRLNLKFAVMLFWELLIVGGIINIFFYNNVFRDYMLTFLANDINLFDETSFNISMYIFLIILFAIPAIFNYVFMRLFQIMSKKDIDFDVTDNELQLKTKKLKCTYSIINIIFNIILITILFLSANKFSNDLTSIFNNKQIEDEIEAEKYVMAYSYIGLPDIFINSLLYLTLPLLMLGIIPLNNLFKNRRKERIYKKVINFAIAVLGLVIGAYCYIDIPEFKYRYEIYEDKAEVYEYVDNRDIIYSEKLIYPKSIWNKKAVISNRIIFFVFPKYKWKFERM